MTRHRKAHSSSSETTIPWTEYTDDGDEIVHDLPVHYEVCPRCEGKGKHMNPGIDSHGITGEEWERDWDDESREAYFSGGYDVKCEECRGKRVVSVVDLDALEPDLRKKYRAHLRDEADERRSRASAERWGY